MPLSIRRFAQSVLVLGAATALPAQRPPVVPADSTARVIAPVVVKERVSGRTSGGAAVVEFAVDSLRTAPSANLDQALRTLPFVSTRTNARGETELSVRGSDSRQPAVFLEGAPMSLGWDARTDPSVIALTGTTGIRVSRTLSSLMLGPNVVGGTVEIGLTSGLDRRRGAVSTGTDHTGALNAVASFGTPVALGAGSLAITGGVGRRERPNVAAPPGITEGATSGRRTNSDFEQTDFFGAARFTARTGAFAGVTLTASSGARGVPAETHIAAPRLWRIPRLERQVGILALGSGRIDTPWGLGSADLRLARNQGITLIENYGSDRTYTSIAGRERGDERVTTARLILEHSLGPRADLGVSATTATVDYDETLDAAPAAVYRQRLRSVALEADWKLPRYTELSLSVAADGADNPKTGGRAPLPARDEWAVRVGGTRTFLGAGARVHASASSRARFPSLRELYSGSLNRFEPNPALRPERLLATEVGVSMSRGRLEWQSALFYNRLDDAVERITLANRKFQRVNKNQARTAGIELLGTLRFDRATILADLTLQDPQLIDQSTDGRTRPEYQPHVRSSLTTIFPLPGSLRATTAFQFVGSQYCENPDLGRQQRLNESGRLDALLDRSFALGGGLLSVIRVTLGLDNAVNSRVYDQCGLPQPGRTLRVGVDLR